jgi:hypothetical protein
VSAQLAPRTIPHNSLYAKDAPERGLHALGLREKRFPLSTASRDSSTAQMWSQAKNLTWDARKDIPYHAFDRSKYSQEQLDAARLCWSRRAWTEYTGIVESPSMCIRLCLEGDQPIETKFLLAAKVFEEARHCEASFLLAEAMGGYFQEPPPHDAIVKLVVAGFRDRLAFNPQISAEAGIAAWHIISEGIAVDIFNIRYQWTDEPVTREVIRLINQDEVRHVELGWAFLESRAPHMTRAQLDEVEYAVRDVIENVEMKGFHSIFMIDDELDSVLIEAEAIAAKAKLGFCPPEAEHKAFVQCIQNARARFAKIGIRIPVYPEIE